MILRELIARFGFDVDEKGAKQIDKRIDGMKKGIGSLGKLMGTALGVGGAKAIISVAQSAKRAEVNMRRLSGLSFDELKNQFKGIQSELDGVKKGAGDAINKKQFDIAGASFFKVFAQGTKQLETFNKLFTFAAKQANNTGQSVTDIFDSIQSGIQGGGFEAFLDLPGIDLVSKQFIEAIQQIRDPGEIGGRIGLENRLAATMDIIAEAAEEQNRELRRLPDELFEIDKASAQTQESVNELAKSVNKALVPAWKGLNTVLGNTVALLGVTSAEHKTAFNQIFPGIFDLPEKPEVVKPLAGIARTAEQAFPGQVSAVGDTNISNVFNISNPDPVEVGKIVDEKMRFMVINAKRSIVRTEE